MREIKFRGIDSYYANQDLNESKNVMRHGSLITCDNGDLVIEHNRSKYGNSGLGSHIIPETLGQFTGLTDKNGADIYCGDLLAWPENSAYVFKVEFKLGCYVARCYHKGELSSVDYLNPTLIKRKNAKCPLEIIGNIHQHPKLLEK